MNRRDRKLVEKVGRYYLQYKGVVDLEKLISAFEGTEEIPLDNYTLSYVYYYILYLITKESVSSAKEALHDRLTYREFTIDYSQELFGEMDVIRTINVYPMNLVAYYNFTEGFNAPEYSILGYLLRRIYSIVNEKKANFSISTLHPYFNFLQYFENSLKDLNDFKERFPEGYFREPSYTDPEWLIKAYKAYYLAKELEEIKVGIKSPEKPVNKNLIKFMLWKLYELYVFYLVVNYLQSKGYSIQKENSEYIAKKGNKRLILIFNASLENSSLKRVDELNNIEKYRGKPDISLMEEKPIIFECKYSPTVSYITMGRFKVMAYTYEYDPALAILVYPGLKNGQLDYDKEDSATQELDRISKDRGGLLDFWYNSHLIYIAIIDPLNEDEENLLLIDKILGENI